MHVVFGTWVLYQPPPQCLTRDQEIWSPNGIMNVRFIFGFHILYWAREWPS